MPKIEVRPMNATGEFAPATPLAEVFEQLGIDFAYPCAGARLCGRCRVVFEQGAPAPTSEEKQLLDYEDIEKGIRLACCTALAHDAVVVLPEADEIRMEHVLDKGVKSDIVVDPEVRKFCAELPDSTLENPMSDWLRITHCLPPKIRADARPTLSVLQKLPKVVRCADGNRDRVTVTIRSNRVIEAECGCHADRHYGVAIDLGTTTIAGELVNLNTGEIIRTGGCANPQRALGFDLISRIHAVQSDPQNLKRLHEDAVKAISALVADMYEAQGIDPMTIRAMALAGNTVMSHLFLAIDPTSLGQAPFAGTLRAGVRLEAHDLRLPIHPHAPIYVLPCMGGFVGGDIVAGILMSRLEQQSGVSVLVDIGTNGEVVVAHNGRLSATSSAAGPAFEGGKISCGMVARAGAVNRVDFDGQDFQLGTLNDQKPAGVCGSGLIEAFARSVEAGVLGANGRLVDPSTDGLSPALASRIRPSDDGPRLLLADGSNGQSDIYITQADVREFQLGKAAVQTAIAMVLDQMGIALDQIDRFLVAGAFGNHLNLKDAMTLGLLPELPLDKVFFIGNSSLEGARCVLLNRYERERAERIAEEAEFVELATRPEFQDRFAMSTMLMPAITM